MDWWLQLWVVSVISVFLPKNRKTTLLAFPRMNRRTRQVRTNAAVRSWWLGLKLMLLVVTILSHDWWNTANMLLGVGLWTCSSCAKRMPFIPLITNVVFHSWINVNSMKLWCLRSLYCFFLWSWRETAPIIHNRPLHCVEWRTGKLGCRKLVNWWSNLVDSGKQTCVLVDSGQQTCVFRQFFYPQALNQRQGKRWWSSQVDSL